MGRGDFSETTFRCDLCGRTFKALAGSRPPPVVVCADCGLTKSPAKLKQALEAKKARSKPDTAFASSSPAIHSTSQPLPEVNTVSDSGSSGANCARHDERGPGEVNPEAPRDVPSYRLV